MSLAFSVIVPARNAAHTLPRCLTAIAASSRKPAEVVVVDDGGSADGTADVARAHGVRTLELPKRRGPGGARNAGVMASTAPILVFVDADVAVQEDAFELLVGALESSDDVAAAFGSYDTSPPWENVASQYKNLLHHFVHQAAREEAETFWTGLGAVRRDAFLAVDGFDAERYRRSSIEDIELGHRLKERGHRLWLVKEAQGSHLKRWCAGSIFRTDLLRRAMPWTELILQAGRMPDDLNLGLRHRLGVLSVAAALVSLAAVPVSSHAWIPFAMALLGAVAASSDVLSFFARSRGPLFAVLVLPLHFLYLLAAGFGFLLGLARHAIPALAALVDRIRRAAS
jgi:glycosyltransferase involved in cell wall biosynthesis